MSENRFDVEICPIQDVGTGSFADHVRSFADTPTMTSITECDCSDTATVHSEDIMRKAIVTPVVAGLIGFGLLAAPLAAHAADTPTTFEVSGGALGITVPTTSVDLGTVTVGASDVSASLGTVSVSDQRATASGSWIATVTSSAFVTGEASPAETVPASDVNYAPGDPSDAVNGTYTPGTAGALGGDT